MRQSAAPPPNFTTFFYVKTGLDTFIPDSILPPLCLFRLRSTRNFQFFGLWLYAKVFAFSAMIGATDTRSYDSLSPLEPLTESFTPQS